MFFEDYQNLINSIESLKKEKEGYGYKYVELTPLLDEVYPKLKENNFILVQSVKQADGKYIRKTSEPSIFVDKKTGVRTVDGSITKEVETPAFVLHSELIHKEGQKIDCDMPLYVDDIDPQAIGSAETYMRRYSIYALLGIRTEDDDGAAGSSRAKSREPQTFDEFVVAIYNAKSEKQVSALWYGWRDKFEKSSEEYKNLTKFSGNMKIKLGNPDLAVDIFDGCSDYLKTVVE